MSKLLNTEKLSAQYREAAIDLKNKKLLITNFKGTEQEKDFSEPANCNGFGRIRHFNYETSEGWPKNPLPIKPACKALRLDEGGMITAQVFQNAVCNWRCWYCYVPFKLLSANKENSSWLSPSDLIDLYLQEKNQPPIIDLSGGQPDITPEWVPWMMSELISRGLDDKVYLWSDDNLSNDYFWKYLSKEDIQLVTNYKNYGRVCCFKGFDEDSFSFNTMAEPSLFNNQFTLIKRFIDLGIDVYAYITLTSAVEDDITKKINDFFDRLQSISNYLPLRTIPLEIKIFNPVSSRMNDERSKSILNQNKATESWNYELRKRYSKEEMSIPVTEISLN